VGDKDPESDDLAEREWDEGLDIGARPRVALGPADGVGMWHGARSIEHPGNGQTAASSTLEYFVDWSTLSTSMKSISLGTRCSAAPDYKQVLHDWEHYYKARGLGECWRIVVSMTSGRELPPCV
jgi:hypothetical protein